MPLRSYSIIAAFSGFLFNPIFSYAQAEAPRNQTVYQYIDKYAAVAIREMERTGIPASITLAQAIAESSFGNSPLALEANNHFGIKCGNTWDGTSYMRKDDDYDVKGDLTESCFRSYVSAEQSFRDHSDFLTGKERYKVLFKLDKKNYKAWAQGLKNAGYATLPTYPDILIANIERYKLYEYDAKSPVILKKEEALLADAENSIFINSLDLSAIEEADEKGVYRHNRLKMVVASATDTPERIAMNYGIAPDILRKYNDLSETDKLVSFQFVYLEPKRHWYKQSRDIHVVQENENMYLIAQFYGVKLSYLRSHNGLQVGDEPAAGTLIYLRTESPSKPTLRKSAEAAARVTKKPTQPKPFGAPDDAVTNQ
jgi:LysM repeat protein